MDWIKILSYSDPKKHWSVKYRCQMEKEMKNIYIFPSFLGVDI